MDFRFSKKDIYGVLFVLLAIFTSLALITYNSSDPSFNTLISYTANTTSNITGLVGSYMSDLLLQIFGVSSFVLPIVFLISSIIIFFNKDGVNYSWLRILATIFLLISVSTSLDVTFPNTSYGGATLATGGMIGKVTSDFIVSYFSATGTAVFCICFSILLLLYISNFSFSASVVLFVYGIYKIISLKFKALKSAVIFIFRLYERSRVLISSIVKKLSFKKSTDIDVEDVECDDYLEEAVIDDLNEADFIELKPKKIRKIRKKTSSLNSDKLIINKKVKRKKQEIENKINFSPTKNSHSKFTLPPTALLNKAPKRKTGEDADYLRSTASSLQERLRDFGVQGDVVEASPGPVITMFEFKPAPGVKINKVANLSDDLALALGCGSVRVIAPIPGKSVIGIEVPSKHRETVYIRELFDSKLFRTASNKIPIAVGKDIEGDSYVTDLTKMPHLLVAGSTGSGKSVFINTLICSILYKFSPEEVRMIMVDPKMLELSIYDGIPHLLLPVVTEANKAAQALKWAVKEMINRYSILSESGCRNISSYNVKAEEKLPFIVIVVDELADLMMVSSREVEASITRLAQMARAAGIHLVLATQRPSVDVITGLIKANFPARISFKVSSKIDSRTILDTMGAEKLLGMGDMLFLPPGTSRIERLHGAFISDDEVKNVVDFVRQQGSPNYDANIIQQVETSNKEGEAFDPLYDEAVNVVVESRKASISFIQRKLKIGYNRAARIMETMESEGVVSSQLSSGQREILVDQ